MEMELAEIHILCFCNIGKQVEDFLKINHNHNNHEITLKKI